MKPFLTIVVFFTAHLAQAQNADQEFILKPVQTQLEGYNSRNIDLFMEAYADTVKVFRFPSQLLYQGADKMRVQYQQMFKNLPDLHAAIVNRIIQGNTVIDQESVTFRKDQPKVEAIAIYKVKDEKIYEVYFISN